MKGFIQVDKKALGALKQQVSEWGARTALRLMMAEFLEVQW